MLRRLSVTVLVLIVAPPSAIWACSCGYSTGCGMALHPGSVVFLGRVISKVELPEPATGGDPNHVPKGYAVHFTTTENFQGAGQNDQEVVIYTGSGSGDCGYPFIVGESYLVYAAAYNNQMTTSICSGTNPEVTVGGILRELRAIRDGARVDDLFGTIALAPTGAGYVDEVETRPLPNVSVHVKRSDGETFSTTTDEHGAYSFASLPRGTYRIEQNLPAGLTALSSQTGKPLSVNIDHKKGPGDGCQVDVFSRPDGQISGKVVDAHGNGVVGFVTLQPTDPHEAEIAWRHGGLPGYDTSDGTFSLPQLAPGRYRLVFHPKIGGAISFRDTFFWPQLNDNSNSLGIELGFGQHLDNVRFKVELTDNSL